MVVSCSVTALHDVCVLYIVLHTEYEAYDLEI